MALSPGTKLAHYEIAELIGKGGMGEVYRAKDSKLGRDVAIKVLPNEFSRDDERLARFKREAKVLASLNHPNIASIYGLEHSQGTHYLVLELVEGETLAERIARGPIPIGDALEIAAEIAEALEEAHEHGIVHRDLKPANIKITPDGKVKVLDFGLAKAYLADAASTDASQSPTLSRQGTAAGMILGTAGYMSPEQAKGKSVDRRADIWAFGVVLFEMLSGKKLFAAETVSETLASVLKDEPDWRALPPSTPTNVVRLLRRCLTKEPKRRLRDIADAQLELEEKPDDEEPGDHRRRFSLAQLGWVAAAFLALALVILPPRVPPGGELPTLRIPLTSPSGLRLEDLAISPDGTKLVFAVESESGASELWLRELDSGEARRLDGTEGAAYPFWSPDSQSVGFFTSARLKTLELETRVLRELCDAQAPRGGSWNRKDEIVFASTSTLFRISRAGGERTTALSIDADLGEDSLRFPSFLPDGEHVLFFARNTIEPRRSGVWVVSLRTGAREQLLETRSRAIYVASGYLLYRQRANLFARAFDPSRLEFTDEPVSVADDIWFDPSISGATSFSASDNA